MRLEIEVAPIETDVLIIGGGLAGCMAAIKAVEHGVSVTIAEKGNTTTSGCAGTGIDHTWAYIPPVHEKMGWSIEDLMEDHIQGIAGGLINKELLYLVASENYDRVLDLERFGINFRYEDSNASGKFRIVHQFHSMPTTFNFDGRELKTVLTKEARRRGVSIVNRVTMTDLISHDGEIAGALGLGTRDGKLYIFRAKAVVLSTGRVNRLTRSRTGIWGNHRIPVDQTGDGRAMALRAGVRVINTEFLSPAGFSIGNYEINLGSPRNTTQPAGSITGLDGEVFVPRTYFYDWEKLGEEKVDAVEARRKWLAERSKSRPNYFELYRQGKGPFFLDLTNATEEEIKYIEWSISHEGKGYHFLHYLKEQENVDLRMDKLEFLPNSREMAGTAASGLVVNTDLETSLRGLYAAGDEVGGVPWTASAGAFAMGWRAGDGAGRRAKAQDSFAPVCDERIESLREMCSTMLARGDGLHWSEVELAVQNIVDYYAGDVRSHNMLKRGVDRLRDVRASAMFAAQNPHELGRCLEVRSIIDNAEMVMRASLEREESRRFPVGFYRADYPDQDDANWLCFLSTRLEEGQFKFSKIPIS